MRAVTWTPGRVWFALRHPRATRQLLRGLTEPFPT